MEWVSVKDRMPKEFSWCIVCGPSHFQVAEYNENGFWRPAYGSSAWNLIDITHWMPIQKFPQHN